MRQNCFRLRGMLAGKNQSAAGTGVFTAAANQSLKLFHIILFCNAQICYHM